MWWTEPANVTLGNNKQTRKWIRAHLSRCSPLFNPVVEKPAGLITRVNEGFYTGTAISGSLLFSEPFRVLSEATTPDLLLGGATPTTPVQIHPRGDY